MSERPVHHSDGVEVVGNIGRLSVYNPAVIGLCFLIKLKQSLRLPRDRRINSIKTGHTAFSQNRVVATIRLFADTGLNSRCIKETHRRLNMHSKILHTFCLLAVGTTLVVSTSVQAESAEKAIESKVKQSIDRDRDGRLDREEQGNARQLHRIVDQDWDGKVSDEEKQRAMKIVNWVDQNDDGRISQREQNRAISVYRQIDIDGDGRVSYREETFATWVYDEVDQNRDGRVSDAEKERATKYLGWVDSNDDGFVSRNEKISASRKFDRADRNDDGDISMREYRMRDMPEIPPPPPMPEGYGRRDFNDDFGPRDYRMRRYPEPPPRYYPRW